MKYRRNNGSQMPPEGWHYARIASVREGKQAKTQMGPSNTVLITFVIEGDVPALVTQSFLTAPWANYRLERLIDAIELDASGGVADDDEIDLNDLVYKRCGIKVEYREWKGKVYANVVDVCAIDELQEVDEDDGFVPPTQEMDLDKLSFE
jgi:hypothetical protein